MARVRNFSTMTAAAVALVTVGIAASGCSPTKEAASTATATTEASAEKAPATTTHAAASTDLKSLVPTPANTAVTNGPDAIPNDGVHLHFQVNGAPAAVMDAFKADLKSKGWDVTTIVTSGGGAGGGGGATYTGTNGDAYGVFDGGGYDTKTFVDVCTWPTKPADPNCTRGDR